MAVNVTGWVALTGEVVAVNPTEPASTGTVTEAGGETATWLLARVTSSPPLGAGVDRVMEQERAAPPVGLDGVQAIADR